MHLQTTIKRMRESRDYKTYGLRVQHHISMSDYRELQRLNVYGTQNISHRDFTTPWDEWFDTISELQSKESELNISNESMINTYHQRKNEDASFRPDISSSTRGGIGKFLFYAVMATISAISAKIAYYSTISYHLWVSAFFALFFIILLLTMVFRYTKLFFVLILILGCGIAGLVYFGYDPLQLLQEWLRI